MTRRWITARWTTSWGFAALLGAACTPSGPGPLEPTAATSPAEPAPEATSVDPDPAEAAPAASPEPLAEPAPTPPADAPREDNAGGARLVEFFGVGRGDRVADLGGVFGYSLTPTRRAIGPAGMLYVRRKTAPPVDPDTAGDTDLAPIAWLNTPDEAPLSAEATRLNAVTLLFAYHAVIAAGHDRKKLNGAVYRALVPGGVYIIADHAAAPGSGLAAARKENRIEDSIVRSEVQAAGFEFVEAADFIANIVSSADRTSGGQYLLKFRKPG